MYENEMVDIRKYPDLHFQHSEDDLFIIGKYKFRSNIENESPLQDIYNLKITFPNNYPFSYPTVYELDDKIPKDYHKHIDESLCLGTAVDLFLIYRKSKSISNFIENILNPYLYRFTYIQQHNKEPFSDRSHGVRGIFESYSEFLQIKDLRIIIDFIYIALNKGYKYDMSCPCKSDRTFKKCHGKKALYLEELPYDYLKDDFMLLSNLLKELKEYERNRS